MINIKKIIQSFYEFFSKGTIKIVSQDRKNFNGKFTKKNSYIIHEGFAPSGNPLTPFMKSYDTPGNSQEVLERNNCPLTKEQYEDYFNKLINLKSFVRVEKNQILKNMYDDLKIIHEALSPMKQLGINLTIDLTGGAVRDFVLDNHNLISDLDVMISFSNTESYSRLKSKDFEKAGITQEILKKVQWSHEETDTCIIQTKLIQACFEKRNMVEDLFLNKNEERNEKVKREIGNNSEYIDTVRNRLSGVIKLKQNGLTYKVD